MEESSDALADLEVFSVEGALDDLEGSSALALALIILEPLGEGEDEALEDAAFPTIIICFFIIFISMADLETALDDLYSWSSSARTATVARKASKIVTAFIIFDVRTMEDNTSLSRVRGHSERSLSSA